MSRQRHDHDAVFVSDCPGCRWDQQTVLLRDTPEDRERLHQALRFAIPEWDDWTADQARKRADAIMSALRGSAAALRGSDD